MSWSRPIQVQRNSQTTSLLARTIISVSSLRICDVWSRDALNPLWPCRVEKEKAQLKAEVDDLQAQIQHVGKNKVLACDT